MSHCMICVEPLADRNCHSKSNIRLEGVGSLRLNWHPGITYGVRLTVVCHHYQTLGATNTSHVRNCAMSISGMALGKTSSKTS